MAILIPRAPSAINEHQHQNGLEWSREEQSRLAGGLEAPRLSELV